MWCRTILTAVAISYVICMLLLSGLQKDDLDANTLEKLSRHNVNIDDMNNENRRQGCLLASYLNSGNDTQKQVTSMTSTENYNDALATSTTNNSVETNVKIVEYAKQEIRVPENLEYKTVLQDNNENNKTTKIIEELQTTQKNNSKTNNVINNSDNIENFTKIEENNGLQIEYVENQPDLQSVMNFWTKLTHYTKTVVTKIPTTPASPNISQDKNVTTVTVETSNNNGYVHSREMEFISRILAEYLASQTVPTTTQRVSAKNAYVNLISRKIDEISEKPADNETNPLIPTKVIRQPLADNSNQINNLTQFEVHAREGIYNYMADETNNMPFKVSYESKYNQQIRNVQDTPYNQIFTVDTKTVESPKYNPIRFLDSLLHMKNDEINDKYFPDFETTTNGVKLIQLDNLTSESFNLPILFKFMKEVNDSSSQNFNRNQNIMMNDNKLKNSPTEAESWEPIRNDRMINNVLNVIPIDNKIGNLNTEINDLRIRKNWEQGENTRNSAQYTAVPSDINKPRRVNRLESSTFYNTPDYVNKSEQKQNFNLNNNRFKVIPAKIKKSKQDRSFEMGYDVFKSMLPSIKQSKRNQNSRISNSQADTKTELNKFEHDQNFGIYDDNFKAEINKSLRNQLSKINDDQFRNQPIVAESWKPEASNTLEQDPQPLHDNQFKNRNMPAVVIKRNFRNHINALPDNFNNSDGNVSFVMNTELVAIPIDVKDLKPVKNSPSNMNEPQVIPENIIREIAEKVKQIVLRDIEKEVTTTTLKPSPPTTTTTTVPTTITTTTMKTNATTTETPSTSTKEITETNHVIQKLMEIFNEFKTMKESAKTNTQIPINTTTSLQESTLNYTTKRPKLLIQTYPLGTPTFNPYIKKTPIEVSPYGPSMVPVSISSGVHLPENLVAQHLAPQKQAPQNPAPWYLPVNYQPRNDYHSGAITIQTNSDEIAPLAIKISKPIRLINQHIIVTTKSPAVKLKEVQERESKQRLDQKYEGVSDVKNHREKFSTDFTKKVRFADNLKMYKGLTKAREKPWHYHGYSGNFQHNEKFDFPRGSRYPGKSNYPASYRPGSHRNGINHHDRISSLDGIRHHTGSYGYNEQDRQHPRYDTSKFHERLERIENWPRNTLKEHKYTTQNCCEEIPPRQQVPLTKVKQRTRFDDTHFSNFLKSQQKVTDMLEKILANNIKNSGARSVETP